MSLENSGQIEDITSAERSQDRRAIDRHERSNKRKFHLETQTKNKLRKSCGKRYQKKPQFRSLTSENKTFAKTNSFKFTKSSQKKATSSALQIKSQIPRALLPKQYPASSSLTITDSQSSSLIPISKCPDTNTRSCLVRQKSAIILAFRQRKSISQMDFNQARRQMNYSCSPQPTCNSENNPLNNKTLVPNSCAENNMLSYSKNSFVHKIYNRDNYFYSMPNRDPQMAGMRIFATIMLNAWRKRRDEVKQLTDEIADLKRGAIKAKNQLHVFNTLFRVEQKRNDELNCQLKISLQDINLTKSSCESLTTSLISLRADKALLEQQLQTKEQEFESLNSLLTQTKTELFQSMNIQRELQASLSMEQRKIQTLENQKNELINEIYESNNEASAKQKYLQKEIDDKIKELNKLKNKLKGYEEEVRKMNLSSEQLLKEHKIKEENLKHEKDLLENEIKMMQKFLEATFGNRLKSYWKNTVVYQKDILQLLHLFGFYLLPALPPPKVRALPFGLSLNKALSIIKR